MEWKQRVYVEAFAEESAKPLIRLTHICFIKEAIILLHHTEIFTIISKIYLLYF